MTLAHLTLNTGHLRASPRAEVADGTIRALDPLVAQGGGTVPGCPALTLDLKMAEGGAEIVLAVGATGDKVVGCLLIWSEAAADGVWADLHRQFPALARPAALPQLLVAMQPTLADLPPDFVRSLGDLERCLAWTILAREGLSR